MRSTAVYELLPMLDTPGYGCFGTDDNSSIRPGGMTLISDCVPMDVSHRNWKAPRLASIWHPRRIVNSAPDEDTDYFALGFSFPCFSVRAVSMMHDMLEPNGELLPLQCDTGRYFAYNVTTVADVLDRQASDIKWLPIYTIRKREPVIAEAIHHYQFDESRINPLTIFRIPEDSVGFYVTQSFADRVNNSGLRGFNLVKVWPLPKPKRGGFLEMDRRARGIR